MAPTLKSTVSVSRTPVSLACPRSLRLEKFSRYSAGLLFFAKEKRRGVNAVVSKMEGLQQPVQLTLPLVNDGNTGYVSIYLGW